MITGYVKVSIYLIYRVIKHVDLKNSMLAIPHHVKQYIQIYVREGRWYLSVYDFPFTACVCLGANGGKMLFDCCLVFVGLRIASGWKDGSVDGSVQW